MQVMRGEKAWQVSANGTRSNERRWSGERKRRRKRTAVIVKAPSDWNRWLSHVVWGTACNLLARGNRANWLDETKREEVNSWLGRRRTSRAKWWQMWTFFPGNMQRSTVAPGKSFRNYDFFALLVHINIRKTRLWKVSNCRPSLTLIWVWIIVSSDRTENERKYIFVRLNLHQWQTIWKDANKIRAGSLSMRHNPSNNKGMKSV